MVPAPKLLHSVEVHNKAHAKPAHVTVVFDNHKDQARMGTSAAVAGSSHFLAQVELLEEHTIEAGQSYHFEQKTLDMGSWQVRRPEASHSSERMTLPTSSALRLSRRSRKFG